MGKPAPKVGGDARLAHHARHLWPRSYHGNTRHIERRQRPTFHARSRQHGAVARQTWHGRPDSLEINPTAVAWPYVPGPVRSPPSSFARMLLSNWCAIGDVGAGRRRPTKCQPPQKSSMGAKFRDHPQASVRPRIPLHLLPQVSTGGDGNIAS